MSSAPITLNLDYIEEEYRRWRSNPAAVSADWRFFFEGFELGQSGERLPRSPEAGAGLKQGRVQELITRYRTLGHLLACLDPLEACPTEHPLLRPEAVGLLPEDLDSAFAVPEGPENVRAPLRDILRGFRETYCRAVGVEFMHLPDPEERRWLIERMEPVRNAPRFPAALRRRILEKLLQSTVFEHFLHTKYVGVTRFSLEGGDVLIPALDEIGRAHV